MKLIPLKETDLDACVNDAQRERIVITRDGKPVALVVGVRGLDAEQLELGSSVKFWELITDRRQQRRFTREQLEQRLRTPVKPQPEAAQHHLAADATSGGARRAVATSSRKKREPRHG